jgi:hypothetical protein
LEIIAQYSSLLLINIDCHLESQNRRAEDESGSLNKVSTEICYLLKQIAIMVVVVVLSTIFQLFFGRLEFM